jgi:hypothetical protein
MKARIIKEVAPPKRLIALSLLSEYVTLSSPVIIMTKPVKDTLSISGSYPFDKYINEDKIPEGFNVVRTKSSINTGVIYSSSDTIYVQVFYTGTDLSLTEVRTTFYKSAIKVLKEEGINVKRSTHRRASNDLAFVNSEGREKKFSGCGGSPERKKLSFIFTFKFNSEKIKGLYKLDSDKFRKRGIINDISEVVGGLREVKPDIQESVVDDIMKEMGRRLGWEVEYSSFTEEEEQVLTNLSAL